MKGTVLGFDPDSHTGAISGYDGQRYEFAAADWYAEGRPHRGDIVDFAPEGRRAARIYLVEPQYLAPSFGAFYFSPAGRITRSQYWLQAVLPMWGILVAGWVLIWVLAGVGAHAAAGLLAFILLVYFLAIIWPLIAVHIKRIHDRNKSGWLMLIPLLPAVVTVIVWIMVLPAAAITAIAGGPAPMIGVLIGAGMYLSLLGAVQFVIGLWFLIEFGCMRGTIGPNRYGADPAR